MILNNLIISEIDSLINKEEFGFIQYDEDIAKEKLLKTKRSNPGSLGIVNAFNKGYMVNKPKAITPQSIYWALNMALPAKEPKMLDGNLHPNICLSINDEYYIGLHGSSDSRAFSDYATLNNFSKEYYICTNRLYIFKNKFFNNFLISDINNQKIDNKIFDQLIYKVNKSYDEKKLVCISMDLIDSKIIIKK